MTPLQLAKEHCTNYQADGSCLGVYYDDGLKISRVVPLHRCLLAEPVRRCPYFEECVAPMKLEHSSRTVQDRIRAEFDDGIRQYHLAVDSPTITRLCRDCQRDTGSKARQLCEPCRLKRRKQTYRESKQRARDAKCPHSGVVSPSSSGSENAPSETSATAILPASTSVDTDRDTAFAKMRQLQ